MPADSYNLFSGPLGDISQDELAVFKRVFLTDDGQFVLQRILETCKFMEPCENERDMERRNVATELLATVYWDAQMQKVQMYRIVEFIKRIARRKRNG